MKTKKVVFVQVIWIASLSRHEIIPVYGFTNVEFIDRFFGLFFLLMKLFLHRIFFKVLSTSKKVWIDWIFISISAVYSLKMSISALRIFGLKKRKEIFKLFSKIHKPKNRRRASKNDSHIEYTSYYDNPIAKKKCKNLLSKKKETYFKDRCSTIWIST